MENNGLMAVCKAPTFQIWDTNPTYIYFLINKILYVSIKKRAKPN